jgi:hypothetical protein
VRKGFWKRNQVRSGLEKRIRTYLEEQGIPFKYEPCSFPYVTEHKYTPDFLINDTYIEAKGRFTATDRKKMLEVKKNNPDIVLCILFQRDQTITKSSKTLYSTWAIENGFPHSIGEVIPKTWIMPVDKEEESRKRKEEKLRIKEEKKKLKLLQKQKEKKNVRPRSRTRLPS